MSKSKSKIEILYPKITSKEIIKNLSYEDPEEWFLTYQFWNEYSNDDPYYYSDSYIRNEKIDILIGVNRTPRLSDIFPDSLRVLCQTN